MSSPEFLHFNRDFLCKTESFKKTAAELALAALLAIIGTTCNAPKTPSSIEEVRGLQMSSDYIPQSGRNSVTTPEEVIVIISKPFHQETILATKERARWAIEEFSKEKPGPHQSAYR